MRLLVTGVAGFIGSNFVYYWLSRHTSDEIIGLDILTCREFREPGKYSCRPEKEVHICKKRYL
jgi:dTDP-D-glucose 4,6-dehydratase